MKAIPTVKEIVKAYLKEHGYDGLYFIGNTDDDYCRCSFKGDGFMGCNCPQDCIPNGKPKIEATE